MTAYDAATKSLTRGERGYMDIYVRLSLHHVVKKKKQKYGNKDSCVRGVPLCVIPC